MNRNHGGLDGKTDRVTTQTEAERVGSQLANQLVSTHETRDPTRLAQYEGVRVRRDRWEGVGEVKLLGAYRDDEITLYPTQIATKAEQLGIASTNLEDAVLAHELGHHLLTPVSFGEATAGGPLSRLLSAIKDGSTGSRSLEEWAAMQFAETLLSPVLPEPDRVQIEQTANRHVATK